jgi:hypothetical protein
MPVIPQNVLGITAEEWKEFEGVGIRLFDQFGQSIPDTRIEIKLSEATKWFEEKTGMKFYDEDDHPDGLLFGTSDPLIPGQPTFDVEIDELDYDGAHFAESRYMHVTVPWGPVLDIDEINLGYPGNISGFTISKDRIQFRGQFRVIQVIPILVGSMGSTLAFPTGFYPFGSVPHAIRMQYRGGMSALKVCEEYPHIRDIIKMKAGIAILNVAQNTTDPGVSGRSVSADGISQSVNYTQSAIYGLYSATITEWKNQMKENLREFDEFWNGVPLAIIA